MNASLDPNFTNDSRNDPEKLFSVNGQVVVVTGGGTGIGLMMASALEHNGATVYIIGRRLEVLERAAETNNKYKNIIPLQADVTKREDLLHIVKIIEERHGYINLLINNAGIARNMFSHPLPAPTDETGSIAEFQATLWDCGTPQDFADTMATNVTAVYYTTVAFLDLLHKGNLRRRKTHISPPSVPCLNILPPPYLSSQVVTISSSGGFRVDARVLSPSYTVSKCATTNLGKLLANLLAPWGIRSNVLAPGVWESEMTLHPTPNFTLDPIALAAPVPLHRTGTHEGMAGTILYLASRAGAYMNGAVLLADGGRVTSLPSTYA